MPLNLSSSIGTAVLPDLTTSANDGTKKHSANMAVMILVAIVFYIIMTTAVIGNLLVISSYFRDKKLHNVYNLYILNLAICDFSIGVSSMNFYTSNFLRDWNWNLGRAVCKVFLCIEFTLSSMNVFLLVAISLDRLILVKTGPRYHQHETKTVALVKIAAMWILSILVYCPALIGWEYWVGQSILEDHECDPEFKYDLVYNIITLVVQVIIPFLAIIVINSMIYYEIKRRSRTFVDQTFLAKRTTSATDEYATSTSKDVSENALIRRLISVSSLGSTDSTNTSVSQRDKRDRKAAKALFLLTIVFAICWTPYTISTTIRALCKTCVDHHNSYKYCIFLVWLKCAINPFLYAYASNRFRENMETIMCMIISCKRYTGGSGRSLRLSK